MTLAFESRFVSCNDALGGEILQVNFDTVSSSAAEEERQTPHVLISRNFEFTDATTIEWHDGHDYDGGAEIIAATLERNRILLELDQGIRIEVTFRLSARKFARLTSFLTKMIDERVLNYVQVPEPPRNHIPSIQ